MFGLLQLICEHMEGHLVEIESAQENAYIAAKAAALKSTVSAIIKTILVPFQ